MTEDGETNDYTVDDHVQALKNHGITNISKVIVNDQPIPAHVLKAYEAENAIEVKHAPVIDTDYEVVYSRVAQITKEGVRHDPIKVAAAVYSIALNHI